MMRLFGVWKLYSNGVVGRDQQRFLSGVENISWHEWQCLFGVLNNFMGGGSLWDALTSFQPQTFESGVHMLKLFELSKWDGRSHSWYLKNYKTKKNRSTMNPKQIKAQSKTSLNSNIMPNYLTLKTPTTQGYSGLVSYKQLLAHRKLLSPQSSLSFVSSSS